ncbi:MAG TPA: hypothetical protein VHQ47_00350 [Phycisphaerae bacterium]|jgi:hypothetical protein|nr:hypothetical protein [Phycisphaerae bacterium]
MALDIRPTSPTRRILLIAVLAALFLASLGFAQFLISRRHDTVLVTANLPPAFATPIHNFDRVQGLIIARQAHIGNLVRQVALFKFPTDADSAPELRDLATSLFQTLFTDTPEAFNEALLDGRPAIEVAGRFGENSAAWLRVTHAGDQAVAFCYSGPDPQPDQDSIIFNNLATRSVRIGVVLPRSLPK